jgi:hypothetical protein
MWYVAYDPSARRDSGTTRSKERGSIAIPEAVFCGKSGGLDMARVMMRYTCEDTGGGVAVRDEYGGTRRRSNQRDCRERDLCLPRVLVVSLHPCPPSVKPTKYALCSPRHRPSRRRKIYLLRFVHDTSSDVQTFLSSRKPRSCRGTRQLRVRAVRRYQRPHLSRGCDERARLWAQWRADLLLRVRECTFSTS